MKKYTLHLTPLSLFCLFLLHVLSSCEENSLLDEGVVPASDPLACLYEDCVSGTNNLVVGSVSFAKSEIPLAGIQREFYDQFSIEEHLAHFANDGFPAWGAIRAITLDAEHRHYLVPVYKSSSDRVEAVISIIHYLGVGKARIDYIDRDDLSNYPSYYTSKLANKNYPDLEGAMYTFEGVAYMFLSFDYELFGAYGADIMDALSEEARNDILAKDCKIKVNYIQETTWFTYNGGNLVSIETTYTFSSETTISEGIGCGGGNTPPSGPGSPGSSGPGSNSGTIVNGNGGPGIIIINTDPNDPNNRCIEDGVGCDEEDEEDEGVDSITVDQTLLTQLPCAQAVLNRFFNENSNLNTFIQGIFNNSATPQVNLSFTHGYTGTSHGITNFLGGGGGGGNLYALDLEIVFNSQHPGTGQVNRCSQDAVYATLIHELFHANIFYYRTRDGFVSGINPNSGVPFMIMSGSENDQHEFMAATIVPIMEQMLIDFNPALSALHGNTGETVAHFLAWAGLQGTPQFNNYMTGNLLTAFFDVNNAASCRDTPANIALYNFINC